MAPYVGGAGWACCQGFISSMDYSPNPSMTYPSTTTFTPTAFNWAVGTNYSGANPIARGAGSAVVMPSGTVVVMAGKVSPSFAWVNDVIYSTNQGQSWNLATFTAPWAARSDLSVAVAPGTNNIVLTGGQTPLGALNGRQPDCRQQTAGSELALPRSPSAAPLRCVQTCGCLRTAWALSGSSSRSARS